MSTTLVPLISSGVAGPLGVLHLPRLWLKASLEARNKIAAGYPALSKGYDSMVLGALGFAGPVSLADPRHRRVLLDGLRARRGIDITSDPLGPLPRSVRHQQYDALADLLESRLNLDGLWD
jgi:hypothetical protein